MASSNQSLFNHTTSGKINPVKQSLYLNIYLNTMAYINPEKCSSQVKVLQLNQEQNSPGNLVMDTVSAGYIPGKINTAVRLCSINLKDLVVRSLLFSKMYRICVKLKITSKERH